MVEQQLTRPEAIGLAALAVWAGGLVSLTSRFAERTFEAGPGAYPTNAELFATALVEVGMLLFRELLVLPAASPPSALVQRPILVVTAVVVTATLVVAEAAHPAQLAGWILLVLPSLIMIGFAIVYRPTVGVLRVMRGARGRP